MTENLKEKLNNDLIGDNEMKTAFNHIVDYIMAKRVGPNGKVEYLVKWEGWHERTATWEPETNFASPQVVEIFETGLRKQMNEKEAPEMCVFTASSSTSSSTKTVNSKIKIKGVSKKKSKWPPMATRLCQDFRRKTSKKTTKKAFLMEEISPRKLFDVEVSRIERVIKRYEPLVGASKRKSRMSCPSSPIRIKTNQKSVSLSQRSQRYRMRYQSNSNADNCLSNTSHEENQNPMTNELEIDSIDVITNIKSPNNRNKPLIKRRQMKINNDSNMNTESQDNSFNQKVVEELSPSKVFIKKVKDRFSSTPELFNTFLKEIIEFQTINLEFKRLLNDNEELIRDFFDILLINREIAKPLKSYNITVSLRTDEELDDHIKQWIAKVDRTLESPQKETFWKFIESKDKNEILKASPDFLWLTINRLFAQHKDLSEEFRHFMPTLCFKFYNLFPNL